MSSSFDFPEVYPTNIAIEVRTNNIPSQNSYQLVDGAGNIINSNNLPVANTTYMDDYNLGNECYKLQVTDTGGDGLQWWANTAQGFGSVRIRDINTGSYLKTFEPDFGGGFEFSFTTDFPVAVEDLEFLTSIKVFPNPASNHCSVEANDLSNASVQLVDALGQTLPTKITSRSDSLITLDLAGLNSGIFFLLIQKDEVLTTRKLIVE